jgi:hypothetical protein
LPPGAEAAAATGERVLDAAVAVFWQQLGRRQTELALIELLEPLTGGG